MISPKEALFLCGDCLGIFFAPYLDDPTCPHCGGEETCSCTACQYTAGSYLRGEFGNCYLRDGLVLIEWQPDGRSVFFQVSS
jgi:hypothetical protein